MNLLEQHQEAMNFSFLAKQERSKGNEDAALDLFMKAANLETKLADYYLDKPEYEPTRSIIIRSAAFLNLKAGVFEIAEKFIFWGIVNSKDVLIKDQLYEALELCIAFRNSNKERLSGNLDYLYKLKQKSISYIIEPKTKEYSNAITLEMLSDFSLNYTKSLKAFSRHKFRNYFQSNFNIPDDEEKSIKAFQELVNPLITSAGIGSFVFSIASDFLPRIGENEKITTLKSNVLINYHQDIFVKDFTKENIMEFKSRYSDEEIEQIFRPIFNLRSSRSSYKISYYDRESFSRNYLNKTKNSQRTELLPVRKVNADDIGRLENIISHNRTTIGGSFIRNIILRQELKTYSFDFRTSLIEPKENSPLILNNEITINVGFDSEVGFVFSLEDLPIEVSSIVFHDGLIKFYTELYFLFRNLASKVEKNDDEQQHWAIVKSLLQNPSALLE